MSHFSALCLAVTAAILLAWAGPAIDDHSAEADQARELEQAQRDAQRVERFNRAAQLICGPQSPWQLLADGVSIQCLTKRGIKTIVAQVRP